MTITKYQEPKTRNLPLFILGIFAIVIVVGIFLFFVVNKGIIKNDTFNKNTLEKRSSSVIPGFGSKEENIVSGSNDGESVVQEDSEGNIGEESPINSPAIVINNSTIVSNCPGVPITTPAADIGNQWAWLVANHEVEWTQEQVIAQAIDVVQRWVTFCQMSPEEASFYLQDLLESFNHWLSYYQEALGSTSEDTADETESQSAQTLGTIEVDLKANNLDGIITLNKDEQLSLKWSSIGAQSCEAESNSVYWNSPVLTQGLKAFVPSLSTSYKITCYERLSNSGASVNDIVTVNIKGVVDSLTNVVLIASKNTVASNETVNLMWSASGVSSCSAGGGWTGTKSTSGTQSVSPGTLLQQGSGTVAYYINCIGPNGNANAVIDVNVVPWQFYPSIGETSPIQSSSIAVGDSIQLNRNTSVREVPSLSANVLTTQLAGVKGKIIKGPTSADGHFWYKVNYETGNDGWSPDPLMTKIEGDLT